MRVFRLLCFLLLLGFGAVAQAQNEKSPLLGTWVGCDEKGIYSEVHFIDSMLTEHLFAGFAVYDTLDIMRMYWTRCGDILFMNAQEAPACGQLNKDTWKVEIRLRSDSMFMVYPKKQWHKRISDTTLFDFTKNHHELRDEGYAKVFVNRMNKVGCRREE